MKQAQVKNTTNDETLNSPNKISPKRYLWLILLLAAAVRLIYVLQIKDFPFFSTPVGDEEAYHKTAQLILSGDLLAGKTAFYQDPFYPYFLAVLYLFSGNSIIAVKILQLMLGVLSCFMIFVLTRKIFSYKEALVAGFISAVYPLFYFFEAQLLKSSLAVLFTLAMFLFLVKYAEIRKKYLLILSGLSAGLSIIAQGHSYFFVLFAALWLYFINKALNFRERIILLACFLAGIFILVLPITLRNYAVSGDFVLVTYQGGGGFFCGNNENASGIYQPLKEGRELPPYEEIDAVELAEKEMGRKLLPSEISKFWFNKGLRFIINNPSKYARLLAKKTMIFVNSLEVPDVVDYYFVKERSFLLNVPGLNFGFIFPLALIGIALSWKKRSENAVLLYYFAFASFLSLVLFYIFARYRLQGIPFYIMLASYAIVQIKELVRAKRNSKLLIIAFVLLLLVLISNKNLNIINPGLGYGLMANLSMDKKDYDNAKGYLLTAISKNLNNPSIQSNLRRQLAKCYFELRDYDNAMNEYLKVLQIQKLRAVPVDEDSLYEIKTNIGLIYQRKKEYGKAVEVLADLKNEYPGKLVARTALATVYKKMKLYDLALKEFIYVVNRDTMNLVAFNNMANIYRDTGRFDLAGNYYAKGLEIDPRNKAILTNLERMQNMRKGRISPQQVDDSN